MITKAERFFDGRLIGTSCHFCVRYKPFRLWPWRTLKEPFIDDDRHSRSERYFPVLRGTLEEAAKIAKKLSVTGLREHRMACDIEWAAYEEKIGKIKRNERVEFRT